jgi:hypothetical protein
MLPLMADLPPQLHEQVVCSISAAVIYEVPANIVLAVAETEGGTSGQWVRNTNGTYDVGAMQFNTAYLSELTDKYGITANDVAAAGCYSYELAAWRLGMHIRNDHDGDIWTKAANYHSRTPKYNTVYRERLIQRAEKWADWLETNNLVVQVQATIKEEVKPQPPVEAAVEQKTTVQAAAATTLVPKTEKFATYVPRQISVSGSVSQ